MTQNNTVIEYPTGLSSIPYASFLQIEKYSYDEAQKSVAKSFNDGLGSLNRSVISKVLRAGGNAAAKAYAAGDPSEQFIDSMLNEYKIPETKILIKKASGNSVRQSGSNTDKYKIINKVNITDENVDPSTVVKLKNGETTTVGQLKAHKQALIDRQSKGLMSKKCMLPLPNEFQYKYGAEWNNEFKLGTLALAADEAYRFGAITATGGALGGLVNYLTSKVTGTGTPGADQATKIVQGIADGVKTAADPMKVNSELHPKNVAGLAGLAPNENSIQFFERMTGR